MKKIEYLILFILIISWHKTTDAQCFGKNLNFQAGEKLTYKVSYNWGFIWVDAGEADFVVDTTRYYSQQVYYFKSRGVSHPSYDWIYRVRDYYETYVDFRTLKPLYYKQSTSEGNFKANIQYIFDYNRNRAFLFTDNSKRPYRRDTLALKTCTFDLLTAVYFCRTIDYSALKPNEKIPINVFVDNELFRLTLKYIGKETITTRDNRKYRCLHLQPQLVKGTIFNEEEAMDLWVTDDAARIPIIVQAKILVGSVKAIFSSGVGLKYQITAGEK